jgi:hypothetical protein
MVCVTEINPLYPSVHYMNHQYKIQHFYVLATRCICVLRGSENKKRLLPYKTLTGLYECELTLCITLVTICIIGLTFNYSTFCSHSVFMYFAWIWENRAFIFRYLINWLVCITDIKLFVYQRSPYLPQIYNSTIIRFAPKLQHLVLCGSENKQLLFPYASVTDWFYNRDLTL